MTDVLKVASYLCQRYKDTYGVQMDEMKLHKLLYFTQREAIIQTGAPMFHEKFKAWKYGPVLPQIRKHYKDDTLHYTLDKCDVEKYKDVFDKIFEIYAKKKSWSLSTLTHCEYSWTKARQGCDPDAHCDTDIETDDIRVDAERMRQRRIMLSIWDKMKKVNTK